MANEIDWKSVDAAADSLGVKEAARRKWRQRGIPAKWQIALSQKLGVDITRLNDLPTTQGG